MGRVKVLQSIVKLEESKSIIEKPVEVLRSTGFERDNQNWIFLFLLIPAFILHFSIFWLVVDWPGYLNARLIEVRFQKYTLDSRVLSGGATEQFD